MYRPQILPALRRLWRDTSTMQLGLTPEHAVLVSGIRSGEDILLAALDGTRDVPALRELAHAHDVHPERVEQLLQLLGNAQLLALPTDPRGRPPSNRHLLEHLQPDADCWSLVHRGVADGHDLLAARRNRIVRVDGANRFGAALVSTLRAAGVGTVQVQDEQLVRPPDLLPAGHQREHLGQLRRGCASTPPASGIEQDPDLVILVRDDHVAEYLGDELVLADRPHLAVTCCPDRIVIGPLVLPGRAACLRCLALHCRDRDPSWPQVAAQLAVAGRRGRPRGEVASSTAAAGLAALQALTHLDGISRPASVGRTLELTLPDGLVQARRWPVHHGCDCGSSNRLGE